MDSTSQLEQLVANQAQKEVTANGLFDALSPAASYGRHAEACVGLTWGYYGARYGGTLVPNGSFACGSNATTYMVVVAATGAVQAGSDIAAWNDTMNRRCFLLSASTAALTSWEDHRFGPKGIFSGGGNSDVAASVNPGNSAADRLVVIRKTLRRPFDANRTAPAASNRSIAYTSLEAARATNTDGALTVWTPDGLGHYNAMWTRDVAMAMEGFLEYFTPSEISAVFSYILSKCDLNNWWVPDHISNSGGVRFYPGESGSVGSRAPTDGNCFLLQLAWLHYIATGSASLYSANAAALKSFIQIGIPYNPATRCVAISDTSPYVGWGFTDNPVLTGDVLMPSLLAYRAYLMLVDLESSIGNMAEAATLLAAAEAMRAGINSTLLYSRPGASGELGSGYSAREMAYYSVATTKGAGQIDLLD